MSTPASIGRLARHRVPGTSLLAWRNLAHDRARFVITLVGIVFSVVLMGVQMGLLVGFARTASSLIDRAGADLWITAAGTSNVDITGTLPQRWRYQAQAVPGVASAHDYMVQFAFWKKPDGGNESVIMVGIDLADPIGGPWNLVEGSVADLAVDGGIILDRLYMDKLGVRAIGETLEINNRRARVVGFTDGIRTFTQSPYVFVAHDEARHYTFVDDDRTTYVLVKLAPGADREMVRAALAARMPDVRVWTTDEFSRATRVYWLVTTGAGAALTLAALLGLVVGIVIVGQTLYASTIDRLPEYATLRAMGAPNAYLYAVILKQAAISAVLGFAAGFAATGVAVAISRTGNIAIDMPAWLAVVLALLTGLMCAAGAVFSIRRVMRIDPTSVFA
ncbi:MAG: ABC transporter permease [Xanthomonadaceae bacterium]|jgi:putative ABC transport system permease protein|nr:ABC transporter permease [Xanthomonadaceae bacterium]